MKILCFDTCFNKSYIVFGDNSNVIEKKIIESNEQNYHSAYLIPEIRNILSKNKIFVEDIGAIGVNIGPGSFTGVRASVTIARVLCQQFNTKLIGIPSLRILSNINKEKTHTTVILDARKNKYYYAEYEKGNEIISPCLKDKEELVSIIKKNSVLISDTSTNKYLMENGLKSINYEECKDNIGIYLFEAVNTEIQKTENEYNWAKVKPLYIQKPSITKPKEKINV